LTPQNPSDAATIADLNGIPQQKPQGSTKGNRMNRSQQIVPGLSISASGQATIEPRINDTLLDLATSLEEPTNLPVDIEHVVAAIILAVQNKEIDKNAILSGDDPSLIEILSPHIKSIFSLYDGVLGTDE